MTYGDQQDGYVGVTIKSNSNDVDFEYFKIINPMIVRESLP